MANPIELTLITRQGCHLCEVASNDLAGVIAQFADLHPTTEYAVIVQDVDGDPTLMERFSDEVPVLLLNGHQVAFFRIDRERLMRQLEELV